MLTSLNEIVPYLLCACSSESSISSNFVCDNCGRKLKTKFGIINFEKDISELTKVESTNSSTWSTWRKSNFKFISKYLPRNQKVTVLELGMGGAQFRELYSAPNITYIGIDYIPFEGLSIAKNLTTGIPIKSESIDIVILNNFIEHFQDTLYILNESSRVLKKSGVVIAGVPFLMQAHQVPMDYVRYTTHGLREVFRKAELDIVEIITPCTVYETITSLISSGLSHFPTKNFNSRVQVKIIRVITAVLFYKLKSTYSDKFSIGFNILAKK